MADKRPSVKKEDTYKALRDKGFGKSKSARIANAQANDDMSPSQKGGETPPYEEWKKADLMQRARELQIEGRSEMLKKDLIKALRAQ